jgi:hypothetical protein
MTDTWKPQPGKPAMTRDEKTLVTDLVIEQGDDGLYLGSDGAQDSWLIDGSYLPDNPGPNDLIEPTAAILAAHGIDADGKPVAKVEETAPPAPTEDDEAYEIGKRDGYAEAVSEIDAATGGDGEYRFCTDHDQNRHTPTPEHLKVRIVERFKASRAEKAAKPANVDVTNEEYGRKHITAEHGRCGLCFYADLEHLGSLECRRFPPAPYFEPAGKVSNIRPRVGAYYWCGEFKEKPAPEVAKMEGR